MPHYSYLIVGGGMTAAAAMAGIREVDRAGTIGVIAAEPDPPYDRPPLSKALWKEEPLESIWRQTPAEGVTLHLGRTAARLDAPGKRVFDDQGTPYTFDRLLLATGAAPRRLPFGDEDIVYYRTVGDYRRLRALADQGRRFVVIGGGFIGSEIAAALAMNGKQVSLVFPGDAIGSRIYPPDLAEFLNTYYRDRGVELWPGAKVTGCERRDGISVVKVQDPATGAEREILADGVVAGIGVQPNVALAEQAGLAVDDGIRVDASLQTSVPGIYAAGDVARFYNPALDQWLRVEHEDNANTMGGYAGVAMAGRPVAYDHLPFFYSDLFDLGYEAVGELDARLETVASWKEPFREGVVYYLRDGRVRGVLLWNVFGQVDAARQLIASAGPFSPADLKGRSPV